jgi:hypothetical protein
MAYTKFFEKKYDKLTPVFELHIEDPTTKFLKLYVQVVNLVHFMQDSDKNRVKIGSDKPIIFFKN